MAGRKRRRHVAHVPHLFRQRGKKKIWSALIDGREVSLGTSDPAEAQRRLLELAAERERAPRAPATPPPPKLSEIAAKFAEYLVPPRTTKKTAASYTSRTLLFIEWAEDQKITTMEQVTFKVMNDYVKHRTTSVKPRTINRDVMAVRRMFAFAKREGLIERNPFVTEDFKELKLREALPKPNTLTLSPEQVTTMLVIATQILGVGYPALFKAIAGSGIRIDEARHTDVSDVEIVDDMRAFLHVTVKDGWQPKSYRCRRVPVSVATAKATLEFIKVRDKMKLDDKSVWKELKKVRDKLGLPNFGVHEFRRAWGSAMHASGASIKQVSVWLGHSSIQVTERYIRVFETKSTGHEYLPL